MKPRLGDVNYNGMTDNGDAQLILNFFSSRQPPVFDPSLSDVNRDGVIDNADSQRSLHYFSNVDPYLPVN